MLDLNFFFPGGPAPDSLGEISEVEQEGMARLGSLFTSGAAYQEIQGTVPYVCHRGT